MAVLFFLFTRAESAIRAENRISDSHTISRHAVDIMDSYTFYSILSESKQICLSSSPLQRKWRWCSRGWETGMSSVVDGFRFLKKQLSNKWMLGF